MTRKLKCYGKECEEHNLKYDKDDLFEYGRKNYCAKHYHQKLQEKKDRERLYGLISKHFNIPYPTGLMFAQIKKFQEINHYTIDGIAEAVDYMSAQSWVTMDSKYGLGLVPNVYQDAQDEKIRREMTTNDISKVDYKPVSVEIDTNKFKEENKVIKKQKFDFGS